MTVDTPVGSKRERNIRNGFANIRGGLLQALSLKPTILLEAMTHPGWVVEYFKRGGGTPMLQNWQPYASPGANAEEVYKFTSSVRPFNAQTWRDLETYRKLFPRALVIKGIMDPRTRCAPSMSGVTASSCRTMAGGSSTRRQAHSMCSRRSARRSATG